MRHDAIEQDNVRRKLFHFSSRGFECDPCRRDQRGNDQSGQNRNRGGGDVDRALGLVIEVVRLQNGADQKAGKGPTKGAEKYDHEQNQVRC